jgi:DNA replication and repair protein RecF
MRLATLDVVGLRNLGEQRLELGEGFTVLWGHNGAGKTNVVEAIYLLATLRSFRTSDLGSLVARDGTHAMVAVHGHDTRLDLPTKLAVSLDRIPSGARRTARADDKVVRSAADFYGRLRAVLFTPEDLAVLRSGPQARRQFLDRMLFARERAHIVDVQAYERVVRSRNTVLRDDSLSATQLADLLATYEHQAADLGARIWTRRERLLADLVVPTLRAFAEIHGVDGPQPAATSGALELTLRYAAGSSDPALHEAAPEGRTQALLDALRRRRDVDRQRRTTSVGPHRDDVVVELQGRPVAEFASQGQTRAIVLALKLAELTLAQQHAGSPPVLLLDDVSSELDPARGALLFASLGALAGQCILTTTSTEFVRLPAGATCRFVGVERGCFGEPSSRP